jgi:hypothetical protein
MPDVVYFIAALCDVVAESVRCLSPVCVGMYRFLVMRRGLAVRVSACVRAVSHCIVATLL